MVMRFWQKDKQAHTPQQKSFLIHLAAS